MLTTVTLTQDLRPWRRGDDIHVSAELADALVKKGEAANPRPFHVSDAPVQARAAEAPRRPILNLGRKARKG